ncbi:major facilitator superfamily domain-containing protein [Cokeromyces recurvatus]|uniref:major facilitator superfamily domain-containing protein n=1 Tax=Cokeromyces recurvatus TaxID=90255 RepID=UPI00221EE592|nr:major facilitator superfamily domain-containing protein [Cokeromyces recurvatus]KAI7903952.1 major facilitator superfamily domain-containing protein [Cokeromyces recurvatus]
MQNYFEQHSDFKGVTNLSFKLSFVETITNVLMNLLGPFSQLMLTVYSTRTVLFVSIVICSLGLLLASFSTEIWHLYLSQGVLYGIGCSTIFYIALTVVPVWFVKHRGLALGIISSGISIGGLVMPLVMEPLNTYFGAAWCYRIMCLICFVVGTFSCLMFKNKNLADNFTDEKQKNSRNETSDIKSKLTMIMNMFDFSVAKNWRFLLWVVIDILLEAAYNVPYYFLPSYATYLGLTPSQGAIILSVGCGMNALGRIISGIVADYIGHVNVAIINSIISGLACLLIWTYSSDFPILMTFAVVFGFFGGTFITFTPTITLLITGYEKFETGVAVFLVLTVISMFGPNLAGAIEVLSHAPKAFDSYKYFTGAGYLLGAILLIIFKFSLNRNLFVKI